MIDATKVRLGDQIYSDVSGATQVYEGTYSPVDPSGQTQTLKVAVKCLSIPVNQVSFLNGMVQELTIQMKLEDCPHVCTCYGYFTDGRRVYIVMEFLEKDLERDLSEHAKRLQPYTEPTLLSYLRQVVFSLQYAKKKSIAHRDIKPQNILMDLQGRLKLVDFGSGAISDGKAVKLTGTPLYMSPEQVPNLRHFQETGSLPNVKFNPFLSDVYSLGITFLHLALLKPPTELLAPPDRKEIALQKYLNEIQGPYPTLHYFLINMLAREPYNRSSFSWLLTTLNSILTEDAQRYTLPAEAESLPVKFTEEGNGAAQEQQAEVYPQFYSSVEENDWMEYVKSICDNRISYSASVLFCCWNCRNLSYVSEADSFELPLHGKSQLVCQQCVISQ